MVTSNALVVIRSLVLVESVGGKIEDSVVQTLVLQDLLVGGRHGLGCFADALLHEHVIVEVPLVHRPHVCQAEEGDGTHHVFSLQFLSLVQQQAEGSHEDNPERAPAVGREYGLPHLGEVADDGSLVLCRQLPESGDLGRRHKSGEEDRRHECKQQAEAGRETETYIHPLDFGCQQLRLIHDALEGHHGQQRDGKFCNDQYRGHGTELGIEGDIVQEEVGERHEVAPPRQQYGEDGGCQQCPLHRPFHDEQSEDEKHHDKRAYIYRAAGAGLVSPVLSELLVNRYELRIGFFHCCLVGSQRHRGSSFGIGDEQCPCLVDAVAPLRDVVAVQAAAGLVGSILLDQFALAAHTFLAVLPSVVQVAQVDAYANGRTCRAHSCGLGEAGKLPAAYRLYQESDHHQQDDEEIVIGHLDVVGFHLKSCENRCEDKSPEPLAAVGHHHTRNHGWQIGQCHDFPDMSGSNDDKEIRGERPQDGPQGSQRLAEIERPQQNIESQQVGKDVPYIFGQP